eukprot:scaffold13283_cov71-Skeletonema_marinoi.AAC.5
MQGQEASWTKEKQVQIQDPERARKSHNKISPVTRSNYRRVDHTTLPTTAPLERSRPTELLFLLDALVQMNNDNTADTSSSCASCGIAAVDDVKLKECDDCDLVKYCSDECKQNHKSQHKEACKKRAAELRDELLFSEPESSYLGDCPICMIPLSLDPEKSTMMSCCSKVICDGCSHANKIREASLNSSCPFCRELLPTTMEESEKRRMKRVEVNDPAAMTQWGLEQFVKGNYITAFEHFTTAAGLGDAMAHYQLAGLYQFGRGVEKDKQKEIRHLEQAAIGGHPDARFNLGWNEWNNGNTEKAVQHWIISAAQGQDESIKNLMFAFKEGKGSKDDLAAALRAHQAAVDATKSPHRETAEEYYRSKDNSNTEDC